MNPFTRDAFLLYVRTASYLRPIQLVFFIHNRVRLRWVKLPHYPRVNLRGEVRIAPGLQVAQQLHDIESFLFLNKMRKIVNGSIDWACKDMPKLWRYNLHYFDYLHDSQRSVENKSFLITDWIQNNPPGTEDAWEPYTASLRIVNWIKYFLMLSEAGLEQKGEKLPRLEWNESLYHQALWLERNVERHFLANHYLKNGVALFFAGVYFEGVDADRWFKKGLKILREELAEQFLADGGHFERSPMYHSICVVDYLDILNLAVHSSIAIPCDMVSEFAGTVTKALDFLNGICLPDGAIPLYNDSALRIAPTPHQIFGYAERVIKYKPPSQANGLMVNAYPSSGYYIWRQADDMIIVDCGPIGAEYNPAHAHCDALSYELALDGRRVIVDSGVFDYEPSQERTYARSTRAHNTVSVDNEEQSEIWGVFRVARRARPCQSQIEEMSDGSVLFIGAHDGYTRLSGKPVHRRSVSYDGKESWQIEDWLEGKGHHRMDSYVHIHPDYHLVKNGASFHITEVNGETVAIIEPLETVQMNIEKGWYFPEFGQKYQNDVIVFTSEGTAPLRLSYRIVKKTAIKQ